MRNITAFEEREMSGIFGSLLGGEIKGVVEGEEKQVITKGWKITRGHKNETKKR